MICSWAGEQQPKQRNQVPGSSSCASSKGIKKEKEQRHIINLDCKAQEQGTDVYLHVTEMEAREASTVPIHCSTSLAGVTATAVGMVA